MRIIVPVRGPDFEYLFDEFEYFVKDIVNYSSNPYLVKLLDEEGQYSKIKDITFAMIYSSDYLGNTDERILEIKNRHKSFCIDYIEDFIEINITLKNSLKEKSFPYIADHILQKLALLLNLSYNTKVDFLKGVVYSNEEYIGESCLVINSLDYAYEHANTMNWPKYKRVGLSKTIKWFVKYDVHLEGNSQGKFQRALNAFSYQFISVLDNEITHLFWCMLGIEALLAEGSNSIFSQIKLKSWLIFGEPTEYKKKLSKLYNYRSRLFHGDFNFPAKYSADYDAFEKEYYDYSAFARSILMALIKELIIRSESEFKFEYTLVE